MLTVVTGSLIAAPDGGEIRLAGNNPSISFGSARFFGTCQDREPFARSIGPKTWFDVRTDVDYEGWRFHDGVNVTLAGVNPSCAEAPISTPCASGTSAWNDAPLFWCVFADEETGVNVTHGPVPARIVRGDVDGLHRIYVHCRFPYSHELQTHGVFDPTGGIQHVSVDILHGPAGGAQTAIRWGGSPGHNVLTLAGSSAPQPLVGSYLENIFTPYSSLGDAQSFTWTTTLASSLFSSPSHVADGLDHSVDWPASGFQVGPGCGECYLQVELPEKARCFDTAIIGLDAGSHMPISDAYVHGSDDGIHWRTVLKWSHHPGTSNGDAYLAAWTNSSFTYTNVLANMDAFGMILSVDAQLNGYRYYRTGATSWTNGHMIISSWILRCAVPPSPPPPPMVSRRQVSNILTPFGSLGNAQSFTWTSSTEQTLESSLNHVADALDHGVSWPDSGFQLGPGCGDCYVQVELPEKALCFDTAIIGLDGGSHMPVSTHETAKYAYIKGSDDGSTWRTVLRWKSHPGTTNGDSYLDASVNADFTYTKVLADMGTYGMELDQGARLRGYKYWRAGGTSWTNGYMIVSSWILRCAPADLNLMLYPDGELHPPPPPAPAPLATSATNILTPTGVMGNAQSFTWSSSSQTLESSLNHVADALDHQASWPDSGFQLGPGCGDCFVQVELPQKAWCFDTAIIGLKGGSHMPVSNTGIKYAYIKGSDDGTKWRTVLRWKSHPGATNGDSYLDASVNADFTYTKVLADMGTYGMELDQGARLRGYKYWRAGGTSWTNGYMIVSSWILRCVPP